LSRTLDYVLYLETNEDMMEHSFIFIRDIKDINFLLPLSRATIISLVRRPRKNEIITAQTNISNVNTMICVDG
jgi:hypothetical protein